MPKCKSPRVSRRSILTGLAGTAAAGATLTATNHSVTQVAAARAPIGSFERPFSIPSLWNSRPLGAVLGTEIIPEENNKAYLNQGAYGSAVYRATADDPAVEISGSRNQNGLWVSDELRHRKVIVPHFPASVVPAAGNDGHCEIYDPTSGILHSFYQLKFYPEDNVWKATKYNAIHADESGWGTPSQPDGPRAAGISTAGGLLRSHEAESLDVRHALAVGAHANVLRSGPVFPATLQDQKGEQDYTGQFPMGTHFMLPPEFDAQSMTSPEARAIAQALKKYGARLVEQTFGAFVFYGEIGGKWSQIKTSSGAWNPPWEQDLATMRDALRRVTSVQQWLGADDRPYVPKSWADMNLLSMRGPWNGPGNIGLPGSSYDTLTRLFRFPQSTQTGRYRTVIGLRDMTASQSWFSWQNASTWYTNPDPAAAYRLSLKGFGGGKASLEIRLRSNPVRVVRFGPLAVGGSLRIEPMGAEWDTTTMSVAKGPGAGSGLRLELIKTS